MERRNYVILMIVGIVAMVLMPVAPCRAEWIYLGSDVSSGPNQGYDFDTDSGSIWLSRKEWSFLVTDINRYANSSGAYASASCTADSWVEIICFGEAAGASVSSGATCGVWGKSYYADTDPPSPAPTVDWSMEGSGELVAYGWINGKGDLCGGDSAQSYAYAIAGIDAEESGLAWAQGCVTADSNGWANVNVSGEAEEDSSTVYDDEYNWYYAELDFSIEGSEDDVEIEGTQYEAKAHIWVSSSCGANLSAEDYWSSIKAISETSCSGSCSVEVEL